MTDPRQPQSVSTGEAAGSHVVSTRPFPRLLSALLAGAVLLGACGAPATSTSPTAPAASAAAATEAATTEAATAVTTGATEAATGATTESATAAIVSATNAFLKTLDDTQRESVLFDWTDTEQKQRWSNLPEGLYERAGVMWGDLSEEQQRAWLEVMQALLSEEGYTRVLAEWNADDVLAAEQGSGGGGGPGGGQLIFGTAYYWIALIGAPSESDPWQLQWGGHHVTINATIAGANIALTPSFIGCQPCTYTDASGATVRPLGDIEDEAFALVNSLDATQQQAAVLGDTSIDLVLGPGQDDKTIQAEGLPGSEMTDDQKAAFLQLISHYTGLVAEPVAAARLAEVEATLDETYFAWYGPTTEGEAAYFRVSGPTIVIEFAPQGGGGTGTGLGGAATSLHVHGIYRDPTNDYGAQYTQ